MKNNQQKSKRLKYLLISLSLIILLFFADFVWNRYTATSNEKLLSYTFWKPYSMTCHTFLDRVTPEMIPNRDKTWSVRQRWDGRIFLTLLDKEKNATCVYIH